MVAGIRDTSQTLRQEHKAGSFDKNSRDMLWMLSEVADIAEGVRYARNSLAEALKRWLIPSLPQSPRPGVTLGTDGKSVNTAYGLQANDTAIPIAVRYLLGG